MINKKSISRYNYLEKKWKQLNPEISQSKFKFPTFNDITVKIINNLYIIFPYLDIVEKNITSLDAPKINLPENIQKLKKINIEFYVL